MQGSLRTALVVGALLCVGACEETPSPVGGPDAKPTLSNGESEQLTTTNIVVEQPQCEPGTTGCYCATGDFACWDARDICSGGICTPSGQLCKPGDLDCACHPNSTCNLTEQHGWLVCQLGICVPKTCDPGEFGCGCHPNGTCNPGYRCVESPTAPATCQDPICDLGDVGCGCLSDNTCNVGTSGHPTVCTDGRCVESDCVIGEYDCACFPNYSCNPGLLCSPEGTCQFKTCNAGDIDCGCKPDGSCNSANLNCNEGTCQPGTCVQGDEGCGCFPNYTCTSTDNAKLVCVDNVCTVAPCVQGEAGCGCLEGNTCKYGNLLCLNSLCVKSCTPGGEGCSCKGNLTCDAGLVCANGTLCEKNTGYAGGFCYPNGTCEALHACIDDPITGNAICQSCNEGENGCTCFGSNTCKAGLTCQNGTCVSSADLLAPQTKILDCYSPCEEGLPQPDGTYIPCVDGLIAGCFSGDVVLTCVDGSCVAPGKTKPTCESALDCPSHQDCVGGGCYSTCETNGDCTVSTQCVRKVCRQPCNTSEPCTAGWTCSTVDGTNGYCELVGINNQPAPAPLDGEVEVTESISLTNVTDTGTVTLTNHTPVELTLRLRKVEERIVSDEPTRVCAWFDDACTCPNQKKSACGPNSAGPLLWLDLEFPDTATLPADDTVPGDNVAASAQRFVVLAAGESVDVTFDVAVNDAPPLAEGLVQVQALDDNGVPLSELAIREVFLSFRKSPTGRWAGSAYTYTNFPDSGLDLDGTATETLQSFVVSNNALLRQWHSFMTQPDYSLDQLLAMFNSVETGQWNTVAAQNKCPNAFDENEAQELPTACFLYDASEAGFVPLSSNLNSVLVPTGMANLPFAANLAEAKQDENAETDNAVMIGVIDTSATLHYPGRPALEFELLPEETLGQKRVQRIVLRPDQTELATISVGGRYLTTNEDTSCTLVNKNGAFAQDAVPWLVEGLVQGAVQPEEGGTFFRYECRDQQRPLQASNSELAQQNRLISSANPIPNGNPMERRLRLLDGALVNNDVLIILYVEEFPSVFADPNDTAETEPEPFRSYGYLVLRRTPATLVPADYQGEPAPPTAGTPTLPDGAVCTDELLELVLGNKTEEVTATNAATVALAMVNGIAPAAREQKELTSDEIHYFCEDTGRFDGGPDDYGPNPEKLDCPVGSNVIYFATVAGPGNTKPADTFQEFIATQGCQKPGEELGDCLPQLLLWKNNRSLNESGDCESDWCVLVDPSYVCRGLDASGDITDDPAQVAYERRLCDEHRPDLRPDKRFFRVLDCTATPKPEGCTCEDDCDTQTADVQLMTPLVPAVDHAFRYKSKFRTRFDTNVGFTPEICIPDSDAIPYCYDPTSIEKLRERIDCAVYAYTAFEDTLTPSEAQDIREALQRNFAYEQVTTALNQTRTYDGFERLYSELLVMLGDDAYADSFASRFDLAGSNIASFQGTLFEVGGQDFSGPAGHEMNQLYRAAQYYQLALDRFYRLAPVLRRSLDLKQAGFIDQATVTSWFSRLVRASFQKGRAYAEIAVRYQGFNEPNLARAVIERAYVAAYLESVVMGRLMLSIVDFSSPSTRAQIVKEMESAARWYRTVLLEMRDVYSNVSDSVTYFGFAPEYVPFPALDPADPNSFEKALAFAKQRLQTAAIKEDKALSSTKSYEVDKAAFQSELVQIRNNYENQLGDLCGTFEGPDGSFYPATPKYAYLTDSTANLGNPCGLVGNGAIHDAIGQLDLLRLNFQSVEQSHSAALKQIENERLSVSEQCGLTVKMADFTFQTATETISLQTQIRDSRLKMENAKRLTNRLLSINEDYKNLINCEAGSFLGKEITCAGLIGLHAIKQVAMIAGDIKTAKAEADIADKEKRISELQAASAKWQTLQSCEQAKLASNSRIRSMVIDMERFTLEALRADYQTRLQVAAITKLQHQATRLMEQQTETEELTINVEAAKNDPNTRIYKNDDIINADIAFDRAIREAYRATKVFEYYTSQSYAPMEQLFLIRMVQHGDLTLENYIADLEDAFVEFEELYGNPDDRVAILSVRDDILDIPRTDDDGASLSQAQRVQLLRDALTDPARLNGQGHLIMSFSTGLDLTSPLTRNHKLTYIEAELIGTSVGDPLGRVYVRQKGTGVVRALDDQKDYFPFPERTAVINTFFNGLRVFGPEIYRNERLRDRPFANTQWELVFNRRDELVNSDIDLSKIHDIRLYLYYSDFTAL